MKKFKEQAKQAVIQVQAPPVESLMDKAEQACVLLKAMGNPQRLGLLFVLAQSADGLHVDQWGAASGIEQPTLSQQIGELRQAGLVEGTREGRAIRYKITSKEALAMLEALGCVYCPSGSK